MSIETQPLKKKVGKLLRKSGVVRDEARFASSVFKNPKVKKLKIVADTANAMGALYIEALTKIFPIDLVRMNFDLDGSFPVHQPDPMQPKNLVDLQRRVKEEHANLGLAPDGDGDRLFIIDEKGQVVAPSQVVSILADELLQEYPGAKIIVDQKYYFTPKKIVEDRGGTLILSQTGHAFITEAMNKTGALLAGEASAHYYYRFTGNAESQAITIVGILKVLTDKNKPLSEIALEYRKSFESGEINFETDQTDKILERLKAVYKDGELSTLDGIAITYPQWRFNVRTSNTEPLLRLNIEAYEKPVMEEKRDHLLSEIKSLGAIPK
jgi:phosphomannomutase